MSGSPALSCHFPIIFKFFVNNSFPTKPDVWNANSHAHIIPCMAKLIEIEFFRQWNHICARLRQRQTPETSISWFFGSSMCFFDNHPPDSNLRKFLRLVERIVCIFRLTIPLHSATDNCGIIQQWSKLLKQTKKVPFLSISKKALQAHSSMTTIVSLYARSLTVIF